MASDNASIGGFTLTGFPPAPRGAPRLEAKFDMDANGMLDVTARDAVTGKAVDVAVESGPNLDGGEVERLRGEMAKYAEHWKAGRGARPRAGANPPAPPDSPSGGGERTIPYMPPVSPEHAHGEGADCVDLPDAFGGSVPYAEWRVDIDGTNYALRKTNRFVAANRARFGDGDSFNTVLRLYASIIGTADGRKRGVGDLLNGNRAFDGLENRDEIAGLCSVGKYADVRGTPGWISDPSYMEDFLDLLDAFSGDGRYDEQAKRLRRFIHMHGNAGGNAVATPTLTGILATLQPDEFAAYNKISGAVLRGTKHPHLAGRISLANYAEFNDVYRCCRDRYGKSLVDLYIMANRAYPEPP